MISEGAVGLVLLETPAYFQFVYVSRLCAGSEEEDGEEGSETDYEADAPAEDS